MMSYVAVFGSGEYEMLDLTFVISIHEKVIGGLGFIWCVCVLGGGGGGGRCDEGGERTDWVVTNWKV